MIDRKQMIEMQRRFAEVHELELQERRCATPAERMRKLDAIWAIAVELGVSRAPREPDPVVRYQWEKLRKAAGGQHRTTSK